MTRRCGLLARLRLTPAPPPSSWADAGAPAYLSAAQLADGSHRLIGLSAAGAELFRIRIPDRGHAAAAHPEAPEAVAFARRPGTFALVIDCARRCVAHRLSAPAGRHFSGHGVFAAAGDLLCTAESDIATGEGRIGLWSRPEGYRRVGEIATGGIGPHDILRLGDVLAVAHEGRRDDGRGGGAAAGAGRPALTYLSLLGEILEEAVLPPELAANAIRHLAQSATGEVAFAMEWRGPDAALVPLLGLHRHRRGRRRAVAGRRHGAAGPPCRAALGPPPGADRRLTARRTARFGARPAKRLLRAAPTRPLVRRRTGTGPALRGAEP
ncbi:DUF1513 domain-containing protein [Roseivivax sp. CAU 1761]